MSFMPRHDDAVSLRDTFAAAALLGLIRGTPDNSLFHLDLIATQSYEVADAMLAARKPPAKPSGVAEAYATAQQFSDAKDFVRYREEFEAWKKEFDEWKKSLSNVGPARAATTEPRGGAPAAAAWSYRRPDQSEYGPMFTDDQDIADAAVSRGEIVVPLYRHPQPTLTDAEREAVEQAADNLDSEGFESSVLHKLLERLG